MKLYSCNNRNTKFTAALLLILILCTPGLQAGSSYPVPAVQSDAVTLTQSELDNSDMLSVASNTLFSYTIPQKEYVRFSIFDTKGNELITLIDENKPAGEFQAELKQANLTKGIYYYRLVVGSYKEVRKLNIIK